MISGREVTLSLQGQAGASCSQNCCVVGVCFSRAEICHVHVVLPSPTQKWGLFSSVSFMEQWHLGSGDTWVWLWHHLCSLISWCLSLFHQMGINSTCLIKLLWEVNKIKCGHAYQAISTKQCLAHNKHSKNVSSDAFVKGDCLKSKIPFPREWIEKANYSLELMRRVW